MLKWANYIAKLQPSRVVHLFERWCTRKLNWISLTISDLGACLQETHNYPRMKAIQVKSPWQNILLKHSESSHATLMEIHLVTWCLRKQHELIRGNRRNKTSSSKKIPIYSDPSTVVISTAFACSKAATRAFKASQRPSRASQLSLTWKVEKKNSIT